MEKDGLCLVRDFLSGAQCKKILDNLRCRERGCDKTDIHNFSGIINSSSSEFEYLRCKDKANYPRQQTVITAKDMIKWTGLTERHLVYRFVNSQPEKYRKQYTGDRALSVQKIVAVWSTQGFKGHWGNVQARHSDIPGFEEDLYETKEVVCPLTVNVALEDEGAKLRYWPKTHIGRGMTSTERKVDVSWRKGAGCALRADLHHAGHRFRDNIRLLVMFAMEGKDGGTFDQDLTLIDNGSDASSIESINDSQWGTSSEEEVDSDSSDEVFMIEEA
jgi:hypothetical protein